MATMPRVLLQTNLQPTEGEEACDLSAGMLADLFAQEPAQFRTKDPDDEGKRIIGCFFDGGSVDDFGGPI